MRSGVVLLSEAKQRLLDMYAGGHFTASSTALSDLVPRTSGTRVPMSLVQEQVWLRDQAAGGSEALYNESITIHRNGPLDVPALERSFAEVMRRHESWRTTFDVMSGEPVQIVHPEPATFSLSMVDLTSLPEAKREPEALRIATEQARTRFDLRRGPLLRARLIKLGDFEYRLFLTAHQIIVDGVSVFVIFPSELVAFYEAFAAGKSIRLPDLPAQYADFAYSQRKRLSKEIVESQVHYWRKQLVPEPATMQWPSNGSRPLVQTYRGRIHSFSFSKTQTEALRELGKREGVTLFMVLLSGLTAVLHRYTGQKDITVGTLAPSGRKRSEFQNLLGYFLNPVALRSNLSGNPTFRSLLRQARKLTVEAVCHDDVPFEYIAERLQVKPDPSRHPFFQIVLSLGPNMADLPPGWNMTFMDVDSGGARWDLYIELSDRAAGMIGRAQYNPDIFDQARIAKLLRHLQSVLSCAAANPEVPISDLALTPEET